MAGHTAGEPMECFGLLPLLPGLPRSIQVLTRENVLTSNGTILKADAVGSIILQVQIPIVLHKDPEIDDFGTPVIDVDGRQKYRCGFRIGGGIDQDPSKSPQGYPDKGVYVTYIYEGGPAHHAGLQVHDKLLQVNGHDLTVVTHKKAVEYISRKPVLNILVYRKGLPSLQNQSMPYQHPVHQQPPVHHQPPLQQLQQQPIYQQHNQPSSPSRAPFHRMY